MNACKRFNTVFTVERHREHGACLGSEASSLARVKKSTLSGYPCEAKASPPRKNSVSSVPPSVPSVLNLLKLESVL